MPTRLLLLSLLYTSQALPHDHCVLQISPCNDLPCLQTNSTEVSLPIQIEHTKGYSRTEFNSRGAHRTWADLDSDCQDTRTEVLIAFSLRPVKFVESGCAIESGSWHDPLTGKSFESPSDLEIDHFIALKEAYESGAYNWSSEQKLLFANDFQSSQNLMPLWFSTNRSKGASDPSTWLPPNDLILCDYINKWIGIKNYWGLSVDAVECMALANQVTKCSNVK